MTKHEHCYPQDYSALHLLLCCAPLLLCCRHVHCDLWRWRHDQPHLHSQLRLAGWRNMVRPLLLRPAFACAAPHQPGARPSHSTALWTFPPCTDIHRGFDICPACCRLFYRTYTYTARGVLAGSQTNTVQLGRADGNNANNNASATATVLGTCANPFGNGTKLTCPADKSYTGPDGTDISSSDAFGTVCCVSVPEGLARACTLSEHMQRLTCFVTAAAAACVELEAEPRVSAVTAVGI